MERALGLMAGAGVLPGRAAAEARRQGWRVVAFAFDEAAGLAEQCDVLVPARLDSIQAVLAEVMTRGISAALFVGKFWKQNVFAHRDRPVDDAARSLVSAGLSDGALAEMAVATLTALGVEVLDQRPFLVPWIVDEGLLSLREPSAAEWTEVRAGFALARQLAGFGIGQTVVRAHGVTVAVEALEGTDEAIRRGGRLAGPGTVVVKAAAPDQDYRFDVPAVGPATVAAMAEGGAAVLAVDGGKVLLVDREEMLRRADAAGIAVVSVGASG